MSRHSLLFVVKLTLGSFNNPDKGAVSHAIVHRALWEYLSAVALVEDEAEQEKLRREITSYLVGYEVVKGTNHRNTLIRPGPGLRHGLA